MVDQNDVRDTLQELIATCRDGQNGFRDAAGHTKDAKIRSFLLEQSLERARFAGELEDLIREFGESNPDRTGSVAGTLHRKWFDTKAALGVGDHSILESAEQGEDSAKKTYEKALRASLPANVLEVVRRQAESVRAAHDQVKLLRDRLKRAA
jgi:uncharacterized protein (TIGR02284 family)